VNDAHTHLVAGNVVNLYEEPHTSSDVASQAIMGVAVQAGETREDWCRVTTEDRYDAWIATERLVPVWDRSDYLQTGIATLFADVYAAPDAHSELLTKLTIATRVSIAQRAEVESFVPVILASQEIGYVHNVCLNVTHSLATAQPDLVDPQVRRALDVGELKRQVLRAVGKQAAATAARFVGTPYLWGGCTPFGLDCSGFTQLAYKLSGVQLLRDAHLQYADRRFGRVDAGRGLNEGEWQAGDLLVFSRREDGRPTHIGLALGDGRFIHSLGGWGVVIHPCDTARFVETFVGAVRISPDADLAIEAA
jgi:hypothetical protein